MNYSQEDLYKIIKTIASEVDEFCPYWVNDTTLLHLRILDKKNKTDRANKYILRCHTPNISLYEENGVIVCHCICVTCKTGKKCKREFPKTAAKFLDFWKTFHYPDPIIY